MPKGGGKQVTANVGTYFAAYRLSLMHWNVMPTSRNARGIDILTYDARAQHKLGIQVKTLSKFAAIPLGKSVDNLMGDFWIIVANVATKPECFIMTPDEVKKRAVRDQHGERAFWLPHKQYATDEFREAWHRIGPGD